MNNKYLFIILFSIIAGACNGQMKKNQTIPVDKVNRQPAVAGSFYPADAQSLRDQLSNAFKLAVKKQSAGNVLAIVSPHAGYTYSAKVAASAFNQIDPGKDYEHIFMIGSSHRVQFEGASIYISGDFITPLGHIPTDKLGVELVAKNKVFTSKTEPHIEEHSLEVQLPFLQHLLNRRFSIVPIILGTQSHEVCREIARALQPYFNENNLFVISTDFSHYPNYNEAMEVDAFMADAVLSNNPQKLIDAIEDIKNRDTPNLFTGMCGWTSVLTLLYMSSATPGILVHKVDYQNSGDIERGDKSKVVGYVAMSFERAKKRPLQEENLALSLQEKTALLKIARETIETYLQNRTTPKPEENMLTENLKKHLGAFVTLHTKGELRGCIGTFRANKALYRTVQEMAVSASMNDTRFEPLVIGELSQIEIEISVLTPMRKVASINEIEIGKHGIYIKKGAYSGTLLPQVASERGWTREEFLGYCSSDKAGLGWNGWKDAEIFVYEALIFHE